MASGDARLETSAGLAMLEAFVAVAAGDSA